MTEFGIAFAAEGVVGTQPAAVTIERPKLQALLDLAVSSLDFGSGFWDQDEALAARHAAELLGLCPNAVTPGNIKMFFEPCEGTIVRPAMSFSSLADVEHVDHDKVSGWIAPGEWRKWTPDDPVKLPIRRKEQPEDPFDADA